MKLLLLAVGLVACRDAPAPSAAISISVTYEGADPATIEQAAVTRIEDAVHAVRGVRSIASRIDDGYATVVVEVAHAGDVEPVLSGVRDALVKLQSSLPAEMSWPTIARVNLKPPLVSFALRGPQLSRIEASELADDVVRVRLERLSGVGRIEMHDVRHRAVIVDIDASRITALGLTMVDVLTALRGLDLPAGRIDASHAAIRVAAAPTDIAALEAIVIGQAAGALVHLRDVARITVGADPLERPDPAARERNPTGDPTLVVHAQVGAPRDKVVRAVRDEVARLQLPPGVTVVELPPVKPSSPAPLAVSLRGPSHDELRTISRALVAQLHGAGAAVEVDPADGGKPSQHVVLDRQRAADLGVPLSDLAAVIAVLPGRRTGDIVLAGRPMPLVVRAEGATVDQLQLRTAQGALVPLANLVEIKPGVSRSLARRDREPIVTLAIGAHEDALAKARKLVAEQRLPAGYRVVYGR